MKNKPAYILIAALLLFSLAGCTNGSGNGGTTATPVPTAAATPVPTADVTDMPNADDGIVTDDDGIIDEDGVPEKDAQDKTGAENGAGNTGTAK